MGDPDPGGRRGTPRPPQDAASHGPMGPRGEEVARRVVGQAGRRAGRVKAVNPRLFLVVGGAGENEERCAVKLSPKATGKKGVYGRVLFAWEVAVLRALQEVESRHASFPRLLALSSTEAVVMEWVPGEPPFIGARERMRVLVDFQTLPLRPRMPLWVRPWWRLLLLRGPVYLRRRVWAVRRFLGWKGALRCSWFLARMNLKTRRLPVRFYSHGDPHAGNLRKTPEGRLYWLDFESVHPERRWVLDDVVYRAFSWKKFKVRKNKIGFLEEYLLALHERLGPALRIDAKDQLRTSLVHRAVVNLYNTRWENREQIAGFLQDVLLDDEAFSSWYREHMGAFHETALRLGWASGPA